MRPSGVRGRPRAGPTVACHQTDRARPPHPHPAANRRAALAALAAGAVAPSFAGPARADVGAPPPAPRTLLVGPGRPHPTLASALAAAREGDALRLAPGAYAERAVLHVAGLKLVGEGAGAVLTWRTDRPYEAALVAAAPRCAASNLTIRHASPSVADNYAIHVSDATASLALDRVSATSATGTGLGADGRVTAVDCAFSGSARYGAALFAADCRLERCVLRDNGAGGVLARSAPRVALVRCTVADNRGPGLDLVSGSGGAAECEVAGNRGGGTRLGPAWGEDGDGDHVG